MTNMMRNELILICITSVARYFCWSMAWSVVSWISAFACSKLLVRWPEIHSPELPHPSIIHKECMTSETINGRTDLPFHWMCSAYPPAQFQVIEFESDGQSVLCFCILSSIPPGVLPRQSQLLYEQSVLWDLLEHLQKGQEEMIHSSLYQTIIFQYL